MRIQLARHFGFCFGVENAIEISYKAIDENPGKRIYLLSQMIHNPEVNADLQSRGVQFLQDTLGKSLVPLDTLTPEDVVIVPAFGTTTELEAKLTDLGVDVQKYNTTCPFVEKVWKRSAQLGGKDYTVVIHGKPQHEETRATFSHAAETGHALVVKDGAEAEWLAQWMEAGRVDVAGFWAKFEGRTTPGFKPEEHLRRVGVVNQTTMLASDTQAIADRIKVAVDADQEGEFANTRDTLCYATNDNQSATRGALLAEGRIWPWWWADTTVPTRRIWWSCARSTCRPTSCATSWNGRKMACTISTSTTGRLKSRPTRSPSRARRARCPRC